MRPSSLRLADFVKSASYCRDTVRKLDYPAHLCGYFYPKYALDDYYALKAWNIELATIKDSSSKDFIATLRLQFWKDTINNVYKGKITNEPVATALFDSVQKFELPRQSFMNVIEGRERELSLETPRDLQSLGTVLELTQSSLLHLQLELLLPQLTEIDPLEKENYQLALSHIGKSIGLATLLRALPYHAAKGRLVIPSDINANHGVVEEEILRKLDKVDGDTLEKLSDATFEFATEANDQLIAARSLLKDGIRKQLMPVFLSAVPPQAYLNRLEKYNFNPFDVNLQQRSLFNSRLCSRRLLSTSIRVSQDTLKQPPAPFDAFSTTGLDHAFLESAYGEWRKDNNSVHPSFATYFEALENGVDPAEAFVPPPKLAGALADSAASPKHTDLGDHLKAQLLVRAYQVRGHHLASLDPLNLTQTDVNNMVPPELKIDSYGWSERDLDRQISLGPGILPRFAIDGRNKMSLREIIQTCEQIYCGPIGIQYIHIPDKDQCDWLRKRVEIPHPWRYNIEEKSNILDRLLWSTCWEQFIAAKFPNEKRFGLEGAESLIPGMKALIDRAVDHGTKHITIGMPHRGRLNVLSNVIRKPSEAIFNEFTGANDDTQSGGGDVKYHLGANYTRPTPSGKKVNLSLVANPSHLEAENPIVLGKTRALQHIEGDEGKGDSSLGLLLHGDGAFAAQGIVYETLGMVNLPNYGTGGTIHVVVNNQVAFTTDPEDSRSTAYPTDIAKSIDAPIFHCNGDNAEAVTFVFQLAADFRAKFKKDVVINLVCYRKHGHNESDQPSFTQPIMYEAIAKQPTALAKYVKQLQQEEAFTETQMEEHRKAVWSKLESAFKNAPNYKPHGREWLSSSWEGFPSPDDLAARVLPTATTGVKQETLENIGKVISTFPDGFTPHKNLARIIGNRGKMVMEGKGIDWSTAEALAFGSLALEKIHVRLSGQDVERGTFSQRHAILVDQQNESLYMPLNHLGSRQAGVVVCNSSLSEFGTLGYELGYSLVSPDNLTLWEAQFGDFANNAQCIIDQFIASGERKWLQRSGLVMSLPHGYDGQGPEHSSVYQLKKKWHVNTKTVTSKLFTQPLQPTTRQVHRDFRKPLILFFSKALLRHPMARSTLEEMTGETQFERYIPENSEKMVEPEKVRKHILCSGQVYHTLYKEREERQAYDVAISRLEQISPFPYDLIQSHLDKYPNAEITWCQEEPLNNGAWSYVSQRLLTLVKQTKHHSERWPQYVGRDPSSSVATGSKAVHTTEIKKILDAAFSSEPGNVRFAASCRQSSISTPGQQTIQFADEERERRRAEECFNNQLEGFTLQDLDYDDYYDYSVEYGRNDYGYTPSKASEGHPTGSTPLKDIVNGSTPAPASSRALLSKELDRLISNKPVNPSPFNPSRFGGTTYEDTNHSRTLDGARLPDLTGLTYATASPDKGSTHKLLSSKRTRLGREDEQVILNSISNLEHKLNALNAENAQSKERAQELENELIVAKREVARARANSAQEAEQEWQAKCKILADEKRALEEMGKTLRSIVENLKGELSSQSKVIDQLKEDRSANEAKLVDKDKQIGWLNGQVSKLNKDVDGLWKALNEGKQKEEDNLRKEREAREEERVDERRRAVNAAQSVQEKSEEAPPKLVLRPFGAHLRPDPSPQSFFSPTRDRAARSHPSTETAPADQPKQQEAEDKASPVKEVPAINIEETSVTATPRTSKRSTKEKPGIYWTLPASTGSTTKTTRRSSAIVPPPTPSLEQKVNDEGFVEGLIERMGKSSSGWESKVPPQTVLARVVRELEDDFAHYRGIYSEMSEQFKVLDPASNAAKRRVLTQHLHQVITVLESKTKTTMSDLKAQEEQLKSKFGHLKPKKGAPGALLGANKGRQYFDSGDYAMQQAGVKTSSEPVGTAIPKPETIPHSSPSANSNALSSSPNSGQQPRERRGSGEVTPKASQSNFVSRKNPGLITNTLNGHLEIAPNNSVFDTRVGLLSAVSLKKYKYRYMFEKLSERSAVLDERIDYFANRVKEFYKGSFEIEIGDPGMMNQSQTICIGRICKETDITKLDEDSIILETSKSLGSGARVPLRFSNECKVRGVPKGSGGIRLFPGRIVGVLGSNRGAGYFGVEEIFTMPPLGTVKTHSQELYDMQHSTESLGSSPMSVIVAAGPYTLDSNLDYEPFDALMTQVERKQPDVVILLGPFVDANHPMIKKGEVDLLTEDLFKMRIGSRLTRALENAKGCTAVLIPSVRDLITPYVVYPQNALPLNNLVIRKRCKCVSNPASFHVNEVLFGISNVDNFMHIRKEEFFKPLKEADEEENETNGATLNDNMKNLCSDIIDQQIYYPMFPAPKELSQDVNLDVSHLELANFPNGKTSEDADERVIPDILILPSILKNFAKVGDVDFSLGNAT
ncbi:2-oxoglutarate dehydrogenase, E1 component [Wallemia mellicola]|nr:2-oxoglutarate dehydrogenase, E1 component [Wallemia mellicola]